MQEGGNKRASQIRANSRFILAIGALRVALKGACAFGGYETTGGEIARMHIGEKDKNRSCPSVIVGGYYGYHQVQ